MSPVKQQRCVPSECVVGQGDRSPVQQLEGYLGETVSLLQFFAHCYSLYLAMADLEIHAKYTMPDTVKGFLFECLEADAGRIAASIAVAGQPVNK